MDMVARTVHGRQFSGNRFLGADDGLHADLPARSWNGSIANPFDGWDHSGHRRRGRDSVSPILGRAG